MIKEAAQVNQNFIVVKLMFHLGQLRLLRSIHDFMSYVGVELLSHIIVRHVFMLGCEIDLLSLIRCMHLSSLALR